MGSVMDYGDRGCEKWISQLVRMGVLLSGACKACELSMCIRTE